MKKEIINYNKETNKKSNDLIDKEKREENEYQLVIQYCYNKYNEEVRREEFINTKAGFMLTIISLLIVCYTSLLSFFHEINCENLLFINIIFYIIILLLFISIVFVIIGLIFVKRDYLANVKSLMESITCEENKKFGYLNVTINTYIKTIDSLSKLNNKRINILTIALFIILLVVGITFLASILYIGGIIL